MAKPEQLYFRDLSGGEVAALMRHAGIKDIKDADVASSIELNIGVVWAFEKRDNPDLTYDEVAARNFFALSAIVINMEDEPPAGKGRAVPA